MEEHLDEKKLLHRNHTAELYVWTEGTILKLFVAGFPASLVEREIAGTRAANAAGIPSPRLEDVVTVDGRPGLVLQRLRGRSMLTVLAREPTRVAHCAAVFAELQSRIHECQAPELPPQQEDLARHIARAGVVARIKGDALATLEQLPGGDRLCHCDLHPDNVLVTDHEACVIDWSFAASGAPASDAARTALLLRIADAPPGAFQVAWVEREARDRFYRSWLARVRQLEPETADALWSWLLPVAVARLADDIPAERSKLLALIEELRSRR
ncbi:MAG: phosphotransferase [Candidatus Cryosericum sp.]